MNSECLPPREYAGARRSVAVTFSGEWAPGPGFLVWSDGMNVRPCMVYAGALRSTASGAGTEYVPAPGALAKSKVQLEGYMSSETHVLRAESNERPRASNA
jgi:hypothetical protein